MSYLTGADITCDNGFQPAVNPDTSIVMFGEFWDIGTRVIKWYEKGGYNGYDTSKKVIEVENRKTGKIKKKVIKGKRYGGRWPRPNRKLSAIQAFMVHHTGGYLPGVCFNTLHNERRLSVQFILDDQGVIYQTLDCKEIAWHGGGQNRRSIGVECCLYPRAADNPGAYRESKCKRLGLAPHDAGDCYIQGKTRKVFFMPRAQVDSLAFLIAGTWAAMNKKQGIDLEGAPIFPPLPDGTPSYDFKESFAKHRGLLAHANTNPGKWDPAGLDFVYLEDRVQTIYEAIMNGTK